MVGYFLWSINTCKRRKLILMFRHFLIEGVWQKLKPFQNNWYLDHWKAHNERISEWAYFFKFGQFKKEGTYIVPGVAPMRVFLMECFCNFLGTNPHSFTKETKFMQSFMELNMKKASIFANKASFKLEF